MKWRFRDSHFFASCQTVDNLFKVAGNRVGYSRLGLRDDGDLPSRTASPLPLPPNDEFTYSTSIRRQEQNDNSIIDFSHSNTSQHHVSSGIGGHNHHPFAHTQTALTPSAQFATRSIEETLSQLSTNTTNGLHSNTVAAIRQLSGPNEFQVEAKDPLWKKFIGQLMEPLILLLLASAAVSVVVGNYDDAASIVAAILIVVTGKSEATRSILTNLTLSHLVGFVQEQRSEKSLEALNKLVPHYCHLIRSVDLSH